MVRVHVSTTSGQYGFLEGMRRSNVAVTRARRHLTLIGDSDTLNQEPFLKGLLAHCSDHGEVWSAHHYINGIYIYIQSRKIAPLCGICALYNHKLVCYNNGSIYYTLLNGTSYKYGRVMKTRDFPPPPSKLSPFTTNIDAIPKKVISQLTTVQYAYFVIN